MGLAYCVLNTAVLAAVALHCRNLEVFGAKGYTAESGVLALVKSCVKLRAICVEARNTLLPALVREMWQLVRPGLVFSDVDRSALD